MSSSGLKWDSAPSSVDNNDAGSWLPIQSKKKQSKPTQPIPDGARQSNSLPYKKKNGDNLGSGTMASGSRRPAIPVVSKFTPPVKKAVSAIPQKNVGVQARPVVKKALPISSTATTIPELSETPKSVKITPSTKAGKETAKSLKDETGIYDLMMFVRASSDNNKVGTNTTKSVHSRDGKPVLGSQASTKKPIEVNEEFVKHRFLQGKPKKKIFSKIKKRILMVSHVISVNCFR